MNKNVEIKQIIIKIFQLVQSSIAQLVEHHNFYLCVGSSDLAITAFYIQSFHMTEYFSPERALSVRVYVYGYNDGEALMHHRHDHWVA